MNRTLELPEPVYESLMEAARNNGVTPADWIAAKLPGPSRRQTSVEEVRAAWERFWRHVVSTGRPTGIDHEGIDADLARAYNDPHEEESPSGPDR